ncbi:MAG: hypothetical protein ACP5MG_08440 [Verrucomicrobiia bacterium]
MTENINNISKYVLGLYAAIRYINTPNISWRWIRRWGANYYRYKKHLNNYSDGKILIIENTRPSNLISFYYGRSHSYKIIAIPQNIECFEYSTKNIENPIISFSRLKSEIKALKKAEAAFCISKEEAWFLSFYGIKSYFLPYYPPPDIVKGMRSIRQMRISNNKQDGFLIMGSVTNPYTKAGIVELLNLFENETNNLSYNIHVVGNGTEQFINKYKSRFMHFYGKVAQETLNKLLSEIKAMIIYQPFGAGALTRIPEMLMAGVPLITNFISSRSANHYDGIYVYYTAEQLLNLMHRDFKCPNEPEYPELEVQTFLNLINYVSKDEN